MISNMPSESLSQKMAVVQVQLERVIADVKVLTDRCDERDKIIYKAIGGLAVIEVLIGLAVMFK